MTAAFKLIDMFHLGERGEIHHVRVCPGYVYQMSKIGEKLRLARRPTEPAHESFYTGAPAACALPPGNIILK
jgi:hypothetical protein